MGLYTDREDHTEHIYVFKIALVFYQSSVLLLHVRYIRRWHPKHVHIRLIIGWPPEDQKVFLMEGWRVMADHFCIHLQPNVDDTAETRRLHTVLKQTWTF